MDWPDGEHVSEDSSIDLLPVSEPTGPKPVATPYLENAAAKLLLYQEALQDQVNSGPLLLNPNVGFLTTPSDESSYLRNLTYMYKYLPFLSHKKLNAVSFLLNVFILSSLFFCATNFTRFSMNCSRTAVT